MKMNRLEVLKGHLAPSQNERSLVEEKTAASAAPSSAASSSEKAPIPSSFSKLHSFDIPTFDPKLLKRILDGDHEEELDRIRLMYSEEPVFAFKPGLSLPEKRQKASNMAIAFFQHPDCDFYSIVNDLPKAFSISAVNVLSRDLSFLTKLGVHSWLFGASVGYLGTKKHSEAVFPSASKWKTPGCFCMTEIGHGSNVRQLETKFEFDQVTRSFLVNSPTFTSRKIWIGNSSEAMLAVVFGRLICNGQDEGVHAFIVPLRERPFGPTLPGVNWEDCGEKLGLNGTDNGMLWFENVRIPVDNLLNKYADISVDGKYKSSIPDKTRRFNAMLSALFFTRLSITGMCLGAMQFGVSLATMYSLKRVQFSPAEGAPEVPIMTYTTQQSRLMPYLAMSYGCFFMQKHVEKRWFTVNNSNRRELEALISGFKAYLTWATLDALQNARECCGGQGYRMENIIAALRIDTDIMVTLEGDNTVLSQQVAKDLLAQYQKQFASGVFSGTFSYLSNQFSLYMMQPNPMARGRKDREHLLSREFHLNALRFREARLLHSAAMRLKKLVQSKRVAPADAWNMCLDHLMSLGKAHVERIMLEQYLAAIDECTDAGLKAALDLCCKLWTVWTLENNSTFYLETMYMDGAKVRELRKLEQELCAAVSDIASPLMEGFAYPKKSIDCPMLRAVNAL